MSKVNSKNDATQTTLLGILKGQSFLLLISMFLSFILMFLIEVFHYANDVINQNAPNYAIAFGMAVGIATMVQFCRVAFGLSGAYEFAKNNIGIGIVGLLFSLILTIWCSYEVTHVARNWAKDNEYLYKQALLVLQFIVWSGFALEIRLAVAVGSEAKRIEKEKAKSEAEQTGTLLKETPHMAKSESLPVSQNGIAHVELGKG